MKIKFDYEKYCTGKYDVQNKHGNSVFGLTKFETTDSMCLYGVVQSSVESWNIKGSYNGFSDSSSYYDLVLIEKVKKIYKNVYKNEAGEYYLGTGNFKTEEEAKNANKIGLARYIQTIEIIDEL